MMITCIFLSCTYEKGIPRGCFALRLIKLFLVKWFLKILKSYQGFFPYVANILLSFLHPRITCAKFGWNWLRGSGGDDSLIKVNVIFLKSFYFSHWRRLFPFISGNLNNHNPKMLCIIISLISFFKKKLWPFIWLLQSLFQRMLCVKFGWILVIGSEKKFVIFFKKLLI